MNKTKVIVTLDPSIVEQVDIKELIQNGTDVFRFDLNTCSYDFCIDTISKINEANEKLKSYVGIMFDTVGSTLRVGKVQNGSAIINKSDIIRIYINDVLGDCTKFSINYSNIIDETNIGNKLFIDDITLEIVEKKDDCLLCKVLQGGTLYNNSLVIINDTKLNVPFLTNIDKKNIEFSSKVNVDFLCLTNVKSGEDVLEVEDKLINLKNDHIKLIAKLETEEAVNDLDNIIKVSDGIMLTRNSLSENIPMERIPGIQKKTISKCHVEGKVSIVATDLSYYDNFVPTKAEVSDIANAVLDGVDAVTILSNGKFSTEVVQNIEKVIKQAEMDTDYEKLKDIAYRTENNDITGIIANAVVDSAYSLKCRAIIAPTISGYTALKISRFRPICPIIAVSPSIETVKSLNLNYGIIPILIDELDSLDKIIKVSEKKLLKYIDVEKKNKIIITGGYPFKESKHTNFMKIEEL